MKLPQKHTFSSMSMYSQAKTLFPAGIIVSKDSEKITTILGSCVSVCLWDPINKIGGMNHFMLPYWNGNGLASPKFGNIAMDRLLTKMTSLGSDRKTLQAKVFGGGDVLQLQHNHFDIGTKNIDYAMDFLTKSRITIVSSSLGGKKGRKIVFDTADGTVYLRFIHRVMYAEKL